jgi:hypothetical protein
VFLKFDDLDVIIECKLHQQQYAEQWANEVGSYETKEGEIGRPAFLFAIGGFRQNPPKREVALIAGDAKTMLERRHKRPPGAHFAGGTWEMVLRAVRAEGSRPGLNRELIHDIVAALKLHDFKETSWFVELPGDCRRACITPLRQSSVDLQRWVR